MQRVSRGVRPCLPSWRNTMGRPVRWLRRGNQRESGRCPNFFRQRRSLAARDKHTIYAMVRTPDPEIHALTVNEISRQTGDYSKRRQKITAELAAICASHKAGDPIEQPLSDHARNVRERAKAMLNGYAPPSLTLPPAVTRETELTIERDAIDIVLKALSQSELVARAAEAAQWIIKNEPSWREMCRQRVLAEVRAEALKDLALKMQEAAGGIYAVPLPMARFILSRDVTVADMCHAALEAGIVSRTDLERAANVDLG